MSDLWGVFSNNLLPIFLAAGVGYLLGWRLKVEPRPLAQVIFYALSPCLVFDLLTHSELESGEVVRMLSVASGVILSVGLLAWLAASALRLERKMRAAVTLTAMIPNAGNLGLSLVLFAFGEAALAYASLYFVVSAVLTYTVGIFVASLGSSGVRQGLVNLVSVPTVYAVILAVLAVNLNLGLPLPVERTVNLLGQAALPAMLVLLGLQFQKSRWEWQVAPMLLATSLRLLVSPALGVGYANLLGLQGAAFQAAVAESTVPAAVTNTMLAVQYDCEPQFVTNVVFLTTIISPLTITPILAWLGA